MENVNACMDGWICKEISRQGQRGNFDGGRLTDKKRKGGMGKQKREIATERNGCNVIKVIEKGKEKRRGEIEKENDGCGKDNFVEAEEERNWRNG